MTEQQITIFPAPAVPASPTLPQDIAATAERIVLEHIAASLDIDGSSAGTRLDMLAVAIATALEIERAAAPLRHLSTGDNQPRYTTKRMHDEIAKAKAYGIELAAEAVIAFRCDTGEFLPRDQVIAAIRSMKEAPTDLSVGAWLPIERADKSTDRIYDFPGMPRPIGNSEEYWCRDAEGRVFLATWADDGKRAYWWDLDGESPADPVEFMPHPLDPRFAVTEESGDA